MPFDSLFFSPLNRAAHTAESIWDARPGPTRELALLREVDLYSFQVRARVAASLGTVAHLLLTTVLRCEG